MIHSLVRKRNALLTTVVLSALSLPAYAADADADPLQVKTDAIVVTASRTEQMLRESPASAEVITRKDIDRMGAENLVQALRLAAGIDVRENGMVGNQSAIRGLSTNQTLILIDGRRIRTEDTSQTANYYELQRINMDDVDRIEIVRGAASSLYGADALGGVINIIRKTPKKDRVSVLTDWTTRQKDAGIRVERKKRGKWALSSSFKMADIRERGTNAASNMYGDKYFFNIDGRMDLAKNKRVDVFLDYLRENLYMKDSATQGTDYDHDRISTGVTLSGEDKRGSYDLRAYYTYFNKDQNTRNRLTSALSSFDVMKFNSYILDGKRSVQLGDNHLVTFGGEYRVEDMESTRIQGSGTLVREGITNHLGDSTMKYAALYLQDEWYISPKWLLIPSVRWDYNDTFGTEVTGKLGTTYQLSKNTRIKANVGTAYRAPTASELYFDWQHTPNAAMVVHIHGNPNLQPEKALNFDLGIEAERGKHFGKLTYFHNKVDDLININTTLTPVPFPTFHMLANGVYENVSSATMQGVEAELRRPLGAGFSLRGTYTYLDARDDTTGKRLEGRARHTASLQLSYENSKTGIDAVLWNDWTNGYRYSERVGPATVSRDAKLSLMNFVIRKKFSDRFSAYLGIDNIFDKSSNVLASDGRIWRTGVRMTF